MEKLITTLLHRLQIFQVDAEDLSLQLISHPEASSIRAITDTLDYFGLSNAAVKIPKEALVQLPHHFIAVLEHEGRHEVVLVNKKGKRIKVVSQEGKKSELSPDEFEQQWTGTVVVVEKTETDDSVTYKRLSFDKVMVGLVSISAVAVSLLITSQPLPLLYILLTGAGLALSYLIAKEGLGIKDPLAARVCGSISKSNEGCSSVINSGQGKLLNTIKLADITVIFFAALLTGLITVGFDYSFLLALSWATLPVVTFSIYLQAFSLKKWCLLCLGISLVLVSQFTILQLSFTTWEFSLTYLLKAVFILMLTTFVWSLIKKFWKDSIDLKSTRTQYYRFKRTIETFFHLLESAEPISGATVGNSHRITFGKSQATISIDAITNPLCGYCRESFEHYDSLLKQYPEDVQINFIFAVPDDLDNHASRITLRIIEIYHEHPPKAYQALSDWFSHRNMNRWIEQYGSANKASSLPQQIVEAHRQWCGENQIFHTPVTLVNGNRFPSQHYKIIDLQFFMEDLKERKTTQNEPKLVMAH